MTDDKPLHVKVAEALGWSQIVPRIDIRFPDSHVGYPPSQPIIGHKEQVPWFQRDWSATGPLIEKYRIRLEPSDEGGWIATGFVKHAVFNAGVAVSEDGSTVLIATCNLLIALGKDGRLKWARQILRDRTPSGSSATPFSTT